MCAGRSLRAAGSAACSAGARRPRQQGATRRTHDCSWLPLTQSDVIRLKRTCSPCGPGCKAAASSLCGSMAGPIRECICMCYCWWPETAAEASNQANRAATERQFSAQTDILSRQQSAPKALTMSTNWFHDAAWSGAKSSTTSCTRGQLGLWRTHTAHRTRAGAATAGGSRRSIRGMPDHSTHSAP